MATQVAGNVNADHEISSQQRNNQQATNRIRQNTMEHADGNFRHNNSSGEGVNGPPDVAVNNVLGSPGQPPGGGGPDLGTKATAAAGMNASNMNQDGGQQQSQSGGMTTQQTGSNPNMDPFSSGGGGMQPNSNIPNQLMDNSGNKPGSNMGGTEGYNGGYYGNRGGNYGMVGQHGGHGQAGNVPPNSNMNMNMGPNQGQNMPNNSYNQYDGHMGPRPGYSSLSMGSRTVPNMPPNYGSSHQRPYGENRIANSAPTLSQLLQGQKHSPSYSSNFPTANQGDNGKGNDAGGGMGMMGNPGGYPSQWGPRGGMTSMSHGMGPGGGYGPNMRNQMGMMSDSGVAQKRSFPGSSPYPQPNQYGGRQYGNMPYPMAGRGQNIPPNSVGGNQYGQQMPLQYTQSQGQQQSGGMGFINNQHHSGFNMQQGNNQGQMWGGNHQQQQQQQQQQNMPPQQQPPSQSPGQQQQQGPGYVGRALSTGQPSQPPTPGKPATPNQAQQQPPQQQQLQSPQQQQLQSQPPQQQLQSQPPQQQLQSQPPQQQLQSQPPQQQLQSQPPQQQLQSQPPQQQLQSQPPQQQLQSQPPQQQLQSQPPQQQLQSQPPQQQLQSQPPQQQLQSQPPQQQLQSHPPQQQLQSQPPQQPPQQSQPPQQQSQPPPQSQPQQQQTQQSSQKSSQQQQSQNQQQTGQQTNEESNSARPPSLPDLSGSLDDLTTGNDYSQNLPNNSQSNTAPPSSQANNDSYSTSSQSPHMHPSVSALRPSPSPVGSPASHLSRSSLSPSSVPGGSVTPQPSPMVPPSSQSESSSHNQMSQSPLGSQQDNRGRNQHMNQLPSAMQGGPPPYGGVSSSQDQQQQRSSGGSFNEGFDLCGGSGGPHQPPPNQMAPYYGGPANYGQNMQAQYNLQGNFNRYPAGGYPSNSSSSGSHGGYPAPQNPSSGNMNLDNRMRGGATTDGFNNSQYGYGNSGNAPNQGPNMPAAGPNMPAAGPNMPAAGPNVGSARPVNSRSPSGAGPGYGFNQSEKTDGLQSGPTPPPNMASNPPTGPAGSPGATTPKGAQAAAAAAIMAAANTAANKPMYHRTLQQPQQAPGQPSQQRYPPPYQQQPAQQQLQQMAGYPTTGGPGGPHPYSSTPNSMPNSMPGSGPHMPSNSMGGNMPSGSMHGNQMPMNSMPNSMAPLGPMMGQTSNSGPGSAASSTPSSMTDTSEPPISAMGAMASAVAASDTSQSHAATTVANSAAGAVATTVTQSITSPVTTDTTTTSATTGNIIKQEIKIEQPQPHPQGQPQPQQVQLVKEESGYGPSSPPIGLLGASPAPLASPGSTSKSSQDEGDSRGSPSVSKIPASPVSRAHAGSSRRSSKNLTSQDVMQRQAELDENPERRPFLERLFSLMEERNQPIKTMPQISTHTLDLFKLYYAVRERGGVVKVSKGKQWKAIATYLAVGSSNSAAFTLKKNYLRYLLHYECVNDIGNIDPQRIVMEIESMTKKKSSSSSSAVDHSGAASAAATAGKKAGQQHNMMPMIDSHDGFPRPNSRPNQMYPQPAMHNNMSSMLPQRGIAGMPTMANEITGNSVTVRDPFADSDFSNAQQQQGQQFPAMGPQNSMEGSFRPGLNTMNQFRNNSMGGSSSDMYGTMGNRGPQGNDPYNSVPIRNSIPPQGNDPYNRPNIGTVDGFNRRTPVSGTDAFPGNNRGSAMSINQGGSTGQQYPPYGPGTTPYDRESFDQQRQHMAPSPSSTPQPPTQSGMITPYPNNLSTDQTMYPQSSRYGSQGAGSRPGTPNDSHTRPPYPNNQQQTPSQPGMFPGNEQIRQPYPQKRPGENFGPTGKRPADFMNQQQPLSRPDDNFRAMAPFNQSSNFPQQGSFPGDRHIGGQGSYPPGYRDRDPGTTGHGENGGLSSISSPYDDFIQPNPSGPGPLMGMLADWSDPTMPGTQPAAAAVSASHPTGPWPGAPTPQPPRWNQSQYPFTPNQGHSMRPGPAPGASPSPSWGTMHQRPSPFSGSTGGPRTLQQALMAAAHRERQHSIMKGKPSPQPMPTQIQPKKEIIFPPDSVEATQPKLVKSKRKTSKDIGPVEAWRLMMSLKSGLLAESTWALDVLNILLNDNSTIMYFDLAQLQGLLEILVDHFRASLKQVFDNFHDLEVRTHKKAVPNWSWEDVGVNVDELDEDTRKDRKDGPESEVEIIKQALLTLDVEKLKGVNKSKSVGVEVNWKEYFEHEQRWDNFEGFQSKKSHWKDGKGDMTGHIMHVFESNGLVSEPPKKVRKMKNKDSESPKLMCNIESEDSETFTVFCKVESEEATIPCKVELMENFEDKTGESTESVSSDSKSQKETLSEDEEDDDDVPLWQSCCSEELRAIKKKERQDASKGVILCYRNTAHNEHDPPRVEEGTCRDNSVLVTCTDGQKELTRRCLCLSNIVRSLSFIPGNDTEMANHPGLQSILGRLLLLHHKHGIRRQNPQTYNRDDKDDTDLDISVTDEDKWWWDCLENMRENALVTITNISGQLDLSLFPESISLPILDGLLHWSVCLSASALDPFPSRRTHSLLSPKRLAIEALAKLSIMDNNVDMILATPPFQRLDRFFATLTQYLGDRKKPVMREFSIVLFSSLAQGDSIASRSIAHQNSIMSLLLCYMEDSEYAKTLEDNSTASQLSQNPDIQPASPDMMRRSALTLACMATVPENKSFFLLHQSRILNLTMSHAVHDIVKKHLSDVLYEVGKGQL